MAKNANDNEANGMKKHSGFTIVEMLIVAPIVLLTLGAFITVIVNMVGDVLATRSSNTLVYNIQDSIDRIENDVKNGVVFLAQNSISISSPQGYNNDTTNFENVGTNGNMLIINSVARDSNPLSISSRIVYLSNSPNSCISADVGDNDVMPMNIVYFIRDNSLWRRVLLPSDYETAGCDTPWQQPTCAPGQSGGLCVAQDAQLLEGIDTLSIQYFTNAAETTPDSIAVDASSSVTDRNTALEATNTAEISIEASSNTAGRNIEQSGSLRVTLLGLNSF